MQWMYTYPYKAINIHLHAHIRDKLFPYVKYNSKQEQVVWRQVKRDALEKWKEVIDQSEVGWLFQSGGALNLKAYGPISRNKEKRLLSMP